MKKLLFKVLAFTISLTMVMTLIPALPAAAETNAEDTELLKQVGVEINTANFPDANFRQALLDDYDEDGNGWLTTYCQKRVDYGDGDWDYITLYENEFDSLWDLSSKGIKDLKGMELIYQKWYEMASDEESDYYLEFYLSCQNNEIENLDLSSFKCLYSLNCSGNKLSGTLDLSNSARLRELNCSDNQLTGVVLHGGEDFYIYYDSDFRWNKMTSEDDVVNSGQESLDYFWPQSPKMDVEINAANFPDSNFRSILSGSNYDDDQNGILSANELCGITNLWLDEEGIRSLEGVQYLTSLEYLQIERNYIEELPPLPASLESLDCYGNYLTSLSELPDNLEQLYCGNNNLTSLPKLPSKLKELRCFENGLTSLPALPEKLEYLGCSNNKLKTLPKLPNSLVEISCEFNKITTLPELPSSLKELECYKNQLTTLPALPASLERLSVYENKLKSLPSLPQQLKSLSCSYNELTKLPAMPKYLESLSASDNQIKGTVDLSSGMYMKSVYLYNNKITGVKLSPTAKYESIDVSYNFMKTPSNVTGRKDIKWNPEGKYTTKFTFYRQKQGCERYGHKYKTVKTVKATTSKNGYIQQKCTRKGCWNPSNKVKIYRIKSVSPSTSKYTYSGGAKKPGVTVKDVNGNKISSKYYTVKYASGRKAVGKYKITVKFKTRYKGTKTAYFVIVPKAPAKATAKLTGADDVKLSWSKSKGAKGYTVYYKIATGPNYKKLTTTSKTSYSKKNLPVGEEYSFKIVPYFKSGGTKYDSLKSKIVKVSIPE